MKNSLLSLSADLRRCANWIYEGQNKLARSILIHAKDTYANIDPHIGCYENIWQEIEEIFSDKFDRLKSSEKALTASLILQHEAEKLA